jgi:hypothetical protein
MMMMSAFHDGGSFTVHLPGWPNPRLIWFACFA